MRRQHNKLDSARPPQKLHSISDLVTNSEQTITSSQATIISDNSQRFVGTQSADRWGDFEDYEDIINQETDSLRITPEEEKRIQSILELARKGVFVGIFRKSTRGMLLTCLYAWSTRRWGRDRI
jgi:hypothetical protein